MQGFAALLGRTVTGLVVDGLSFIQFSLHGKLEVPAKVKLRRSRWNTQELFTVGPIYSSVVVCGR